MLKFFQTKYFPLHLSRMILFYLSQIFAIVVLSQSLKWSIETHQRNAKAQSLRQRTIGGIQVHTGYTRTSVNESLIDNNEDIFK